MVVSEKRECFKSLKVTVISTKYEENCEACLPQAIMNAYKANMI